MPFFVQRANGGLSPALCFLRPEFSQSKWRFKDGQEPDLAALHEPHFPIIAVESGFWKLEELVELD